MDDVAFLEKLLSIPSPSGGEDIFADCVSQFTWLPAPQAAPQSWVDTRRKVTTWVAEVADPVPSDGEVLFKGRLHGKG